MRKILLSSAAIALFCANIGFADNITIYDEDGYSGTGQGSEVGETEPNMIRDNNWDLKEFTLTGNNLGVVSGFDLKDGYDYGGHHYSAGDIFIDVTGDAQYGTLGHNRGTSTLANFGYEYAIKLTYTSSTIGSYNIYSLTNTSKLGGVSEVQNTPESLPFNLLLGSEAVASRGFFSYSDFNGSTSNSINGIDLSFLKGASFTSHLTLSCGNDNLMGSGKTTNVPEPSSVSLILVGISLFAGLKIRSSRK